MKGIEVLENELLTMLENIKRIKENQYDNIKSEYEYKQSCSNLTSEFKHRIATLKQILTLVSTLRTKHIFDKEYSKFEKCIFCENKPYKKGASYCQTHINCDDYS
jgi:hypothetical protein